MNKQAVTMFQQTVKVQDEYIWIKPICDFFEISYRWQSEVIRNDHILPTTVRKSCNEALFGDKRKRIALTKFGFIRWIQAINPTIIKKELQEQFKQYQALIFDFLFGSVKRNKRAKTLYARLKKLKRLKNKITSEITNVKTQLEEHWDQKYLQTSIKFEQLEEDNEQS